MRPFTTILITLTLGSRALIAQDASEASAVEAKLRESLRATTQQLRAAQTEKAQALADLELLKATSEKEKKEAEARFAELTTRTTNEREESEKKIAEMEKELGQRAARLEALSASLSKWQASHAELGEVARAKEQERANLASKASVLEQKVEDRERRNLELYQTAKEILGRYEKFSLGRALAAREPFTGLARVKLEEQIQDYRDKLADGLIRTGEPAKPSGPASPAALSQPADLEKVVPSAPAQP
jgi:chromosome segregation ATPase